MRATNVLALDIGSSSTRGAVFDLRGKSRAMITRSYSMRYSHDGGAELSADELLKAARSCVVHCQASRCDLICASAFWHGLLGLDHKLRPVTPIYTWADSRSRADAGDLRREFSESKILQRTGCMLRFPFWPAKLCWLRRTERTLFRRVRFWVSPADRIFHELFGELATSESMASATGLYNQITRAWDREVCGAIGITDSQLPPIRAALPGGTIYCAIGDGAASNLGSGTDSKIAAINLGTSAAVRVVLSRTYRRRIPHGLFCYVVDEKRCVVGGAISNAGNLHQWCVRELRLAKNLRISREAASTDQLIVLPYLFAERSPNWPETRAALTGINQTTTNNEIARVLITSAVYQLADCFDLLEKSCGPFERVIISGGMAKSVDAIRILADAISRDVELTHDRQASLRGAAVHALRQIGITLPALKGGRIMRHDRHLAHNHRARRERQSALAHLLARP